MDLGVSLAHELVHCAQLIRGTMKIGNRDSVIWAGKKRLPNRRLFFVVLLKEFDNNVETFDYFIGARKMCCLTKK